MPTYDTLSDLAALGHLSCRERQDVLFVLRSAFEQLSNLLLFELLVRLGG